MSTAQITPEVLGDLVLKGIEHEYRVLLQARLEEVAREVAVQAAKNVVKWTTAYHRYMEGDVALFVQFGDLPPGTMPPPVPL